jgi:ketosteroid isomerase-like protein
MSPTFIILSASIILGLAVDAGGQLDNRSFQGLVDADRAFSRMSEDKGVREAFLFYLADDSVVFRPKPVPGRKVYEDMPPATGAVLTWSPEFAEVSAGGDIGYTTGPYMAGDRSKPGTPAAYGHYVSVWERQANREWKVSLDAGIRHPQSGPAVKTVATLPAGYKRWRGPRIDRDAERTLLLQEEAGFAQTARAEGLSEAYLTYAADDVRFCRDGALPVTGKAALLKLVSSSVRKYSWGPVDAVVSSTGDIGYVFGGSEGVSADKNVPFETSSYLRIWRKLVGGQWRIVLDLAVPVPAESGPN